MLRIENLTKKFGDKTAVNNLSLHIQPGEIYGFIGHNGAGKTTTIKSVCGILQFDSGNIYVNGVSLKEDPVACKKEIAYIPDNPETPFEMVNKYGTYEIQPTGETDNEFPTIAQGLPKQAKKPTVKPINHSKKSQI